MTDNFSQTRRYYDSLLQTTSYEQLVNGHADSVHEIFLKYPENVRAGFKSTTQNGLFAEGVPFVVDALNFLTASDFPNLNTLRSFYESRIAIRKQKVYEVPYDDVVHELLLSPQLPLLMCNYKLSVAVPIARDLITHFTNSELIANIRLLTRSYQQRDRKLFEPWSSETAVSIVSGVLASDLYQQSRYYDIPLYLWTAFFTDTWRCVVNNLDLANSPYPSAIIEFGEQLKNNILKKCN